MGKSDKEFAFMENGSRCKEFYLGMVNSKHAKMWPPRTQVPTSKNVNKSVLCRTRKLFLKNQKCSNIGPIGVLY